MKKEQITDKEGICLLMIFVLGSTMIIGIGGEAKNDAWIAGVLGIIISAPMIIVYGRIRSLFPDKDLFDILETVLGKVIGRAVGIIYIWYAFHLGALVIRNFGEYINDVTMPETPMFIPMLFLGLVCIAAAKAGIEVMARISAYAMPFFLFTIVSVQLLAITDIKLHFLKPVLGNGFSPIMKGAFSAFAFPFAETVLFVEILFFLKTGKSQYKVYLSGLFFAGIIIIILTIRNIVILGDTVSYFYFPSHVAVGRIKIGDFIERIEVTVSLSFVLGVFVKTSVCLFVTCKGIAKMFNLSDYRPIVMQIGLLMTYFSLIVYKNIMEMKYWAFKVYSYYAFPFQVIIPLLLIIIAEFKMRHKKQN